MWTWRVIAILSIAQAGAYLGQETARYFWDLTAYVAALDTAYPYRFADPYPFIYPPVAADLFKLARSHLFELLSMAYVGAAALFVTALARLDATRKFEWVFAVTAMGGLGVVSLQSGNIGILLNLTALALALRAALGNEAARRLLPVAIGLGALIKPQFALYLGLLACSEPSWRRALATGAAVVAGVAAVHGGYIVLRPEDWQEYTRALLTRTTVEKDFGWGPAGMAMQFSTSNSAAFAAYATALAVVASLGYLAWQPLARLSPPARRVAATGLAFVVLTFANPRIPLYDLYAAAIALAVTCAVAERGPRLATVLAGVMALSFIPWLIDNFTVAPSTFPWWTRHLLLAHLGGIVALLLALAATPSSEGARTATPR